MINNSIPRLDKDTELREQLLPYCRLQRGQIWQDSLRGHRVGCLDATNSAEIRDLMQGERAALAIQDPPYNLVAFETRLVDEYIAACKQWIATTRESLAPNSSLYVWLGADQNDGFQPLPEFMLMMRETEFRSRSFITVRNQRGFGTQKNWMSVRQELLYYTLGEPKFQPQYTEIPKALRGYYKEVSGQVSENMERGKSPFIRAGNVWIDVQQVFYRMEENVNGCYAQKPLKAIKRIIDASSDAGNLVIDFFAHSGTTLLQSEISGRRCFTADIDPIFCEITMRRLEHFRKTGRTGWQNDNPFWQELGPQNAYQERDLQASFLREESEEWKS